MKIHTKIFLFTIMATWRLRGYVKEYAKIYSVSPLYLIFRYINDWFEKSNENEYLALVLTNESKEKIKNMKNCGVKSEI